MEVLILCCSLRSFANGSSRSRRRAVKTRFAPPAANSFASATPIPALAPVINAHFPRHSEFMKLSLLLALAHAACQPAYLNARRIAADTHAGLAVDRF